MHDTRLHPSHPTRQERVDKAVKPLTKKQQAQVQALRLKMFRRLEVNDVGGLIFDQALADRIAAIEEKTGLREFEIQAILFYFHDAPEAEMMEFLEKYKAASQYALEVFARPQCYLVPFLNAMIEQREMDKMSEPVRKAYLGTVFMGDREPEHSLHSVKLAMEGVKDRAKMEAWMKERNKHQFGDELEGRLAREQRERDRAARKEKEESANE